MVLTHWANKENRLIVSRSCERSHQPQAIPSEVADRTQDAGPLSGTYRLALCIQTRANPFCESL